MIGSVAYLAIQLITEAVKESIAEKEKAEVTTTKAITTTKAPTTTTKPSDDSLVVPE